MQETKYQEIIKLLLLAVNRSLLYSISHPLVKLSLNSLQEIINKQDDPENEVVISLRGSKLYINEFQMSEKGLQSNDVIKKLESLHIESLNLKPGISLDELEKLAVFLGVGKKPGQGQESLQAFLKQGTEHIKINLLRFKAVKEDEKVVSNVLEDANEYLKAKTTSGEKGRSDEPLEYIFGKKDSLKAEQKQKIAQSLLSEPKKVPEIINGVLKQKGLHSVLSSILSDLGSQITEKLSEKRNPVKTLNDLKRAIEKTLEQAYPKEQLPAQKEALAKIFDEFSDNIKAKLVLLLFEYSKGRDEKFLPKTARIFESGEEFKRVSQRIKEEFSKLGMSEEDSESLISKIEDRLSSQIKVTVSKKEYEQLKNKADLFDKTLIEQIKQVTAELEFKTKRMTDQKERVDNILRNIADGLVVVDKEGKVVMINPAAEALLGVEKGIQVGKPLLDNVQKHQLIALTKGNPSDESQINKVIELKGADEQTKKVLKASTAVVENEDGSTVGMVMTLSDITRERQLEKMKADFTAHMSHELRTPLIAAKKSISLILMKTAGQINDDQNRFLSIADSNLSRLSRLIDQILDAAKIDSGHFRLTASRFNLVELSRETSQSLSGWMQDKQISFSFESEKENIEILADKEKISGVIINLLSNACKYTPQKGKVVLRLKEQARAQAVVEISVSDTGIGIEEKDYERVFEEYEQVSLTSPPGIGSTGLGLYICKSIVLMHGGKIWVQSKMGEGSVFYVELPKEYKEQEEQV